MKVELKIEAAGVQVYAYEITVDQEDFILRKDSLYYKKYAKVPFSGIRKEFNETGVRLKESWENGKLHGPGEYFDEDG